MLSLSILVLVLMRGRLGVVSGGMPPGMQELLSDPEILMAFQVWFLAVV